MPAHPEAEHAYDVSQLLGDLARCHTALGHFEAAIKAVKRMLTRGWERRPDGRHLIAGILIKAGRSDEADRLYAAIRDDAPDDASLHDAAAWAYHSARDAATTIPKRSSATMRPTWSGSSPRSRGEAIAPCWATSKRPTSFTPEDFRRRVADLRLANANRPALLEELDRL